MSTTQTFCKTEMWQPEPTKNLVERIPVEEGRKRSTFNEKQKSVQGCTWEDLRGLSFGFKEELF